MTKRLPPFKRQTHYRAAAQRWVSELAYTYAISGRKDEANFELKRLLRLAKEHYESPYDIAVVNVGLGQKDKALTWLERAVADRAWESMCLQVESKLDRLQSNPRFKELIRRIGLSSERTSALGAGQSSSH